MTPGICLHVRFTMFTQIKLLLQLPAQDRDFHIFNSNMIIANKWLISPQSLKIFILFGFDNSTRPTCNRNEDVARDVLWEPGRGSNFERQIVKLGVGLNSLSWSSHSIYLYVCKKL